MHIAKFLAGAAIIAAPLSLLSAQSTTPTDSGSHGHRGQWIAGTGAAGASLFLAFTHSAHNGSNNNFSFQSPNPPATVPDPSSNGASTQSDETAAPDSSVTPPDSGAVTPPDTASVTSDTGSVTKPARDQGPPDKPPTYQNDYPPPDAGPPAPDTSTVPEPSSVALIATGIIGLVPLVRRRR